MWVIYDTAFGEKQMEMLMLRNMMFGCLAMWKSEESDMDVE